MQKKAYKHILVLENMPLPSRHNTEMTARNKSAGSLFNTRPREQYSKALCNIMGHTSDDDTVDLSLIAA